VKYVKIELQVLSLEDFDRKFQMWSQVLSLENAIRHGMRAYRSCGCACPDQFFSLRRSVLVEG
jgi:hypothetical protein